MPLMPGTPRAPRCVAMRPPIDLPPMKTRVRPLAAARSRVHASTCSKAASSTGARSGHLAPRVHVGEVEGHDVDAAGRDGLGDPDHERVVLAGAGAVGEQQRRVGRLLAGVVGGRRRVVTLDRV